MLIEILSLDVVYLTQGEIIFLWLRVAVWQLLLLFND